MARMPAAVAFFDADNEAETEICKLADLLCCRVDWPWLLAGSPLLRHGWTPGCGYCRFIGTATTRR